MIEPFQRDDVLLAEIATLRSEPGFRIWWLGQSGFLLQWNGKHLLFDPYLSDSLTKKYANTDKPHIRMTRRVVAPERLDFLEVVTSSHNHTDHLDAETLNPLRAANPNLQFVIPEANRDFVEQRLGCPRDWPIGLDDGSTALIGGFEFHSIASAHESLDRNPQGRYPYLGYVVRFGQWTVYHPGDTIRYDGMAEKLRHFDIDVAMLPINGRSAERRVPGNLDGREAAELAHDIGAKTTIPCHYDMFEFNTTTPVCFLETCRALGIQACVLRVGERFDSACIKEPGTQ
jgi:L-ascorbate metabolism protein UlaG (beta-lactamase superfamily)